MAGSYVQVEMSKLPSWSDFASPATVLQKTGYFVGSKLGRHCAQLTKPVSDTLTVARTQAKSEFSLRKQQAQTALEENAGAIMFVAAAAISWQHDPFTIATMGSLELFRAYKCGPLFPVGESDLSTALIKSVDGVLRAAVKLALVFQPAVSMSLNLAAGRAVTTPTATTSESDNKSNTGTLSRIQSVKKWVDDLPQTEWIVKLQQTPPIGDDKEFRVVNPLMTATAVTSAVACILYSVPTYYYSASIAFQVVVLSTKALNAVMMAAALENVWQRVKIATVPVPEKAVAAENPAS